MKTLQTPLPGLAILALAIPDNLPAANVPARPLQSFVEGDWKPLAATKEKPFASPANVRDGATHWTDSFSHGELLRAGCDEKMEVDPTHLRFLFQGVSDSRRAGKKYGEIPWELGLLEPQP